MDTSLKNLQQQITELKRQNAELHSKLEIVNRIFAVSVPILITDSQSKISWVNQAYTQLTGYSPEEMMGKLPSIFTVKLQDEAYFQNLRYSIKTNGFWQGEVLDKQKDGTIYSQWLNITAIYDEFGKVNSYVAIFTDFTERVEYEKMLRQAKKEAEAASQAKSNFLVTMSHEIRTPLNAIIGLSYLLKDTQLNSSQKKDLEVIDVSSKNLLHLINDLLDFSKIEAGEMEVDHHSFSISDVISDMDVMFSAMVFNKNIKFLIDTKSSFPSLMIGDSYRLKQILINVINNSIKFTKEGYVKLVVNSLEKEGMKHWVKFSVIDTGIGISTENQKKLFQPFSQADESTTREFGGTGLGLSIVKKLVDLMEGYVILESELGKGTTFNFILPFQENNLVTSQVIYQELKQSLQGIKILAVDDSSINLDVIESLLKREQAIVIVSDSGRKALKTIDDFDGKFDLILMDLQMPEMDGCDASIEIRKKEGYKNVPILALTAGATSRERQRAFDSGMNDFLTKPVNPFNLVNTLLKHLRNSTNSETQIEQENISALLNIEGINRHHVLNTIGDDIDFFADLLQNFVTENSDIIEKMKALLSEEKYHEASKVIHKFSGQSGALGAMKLHRIAKNLERVLKSQQSNYIVIFKKFDDEYQKLFSEIRDYLTRLE